MKAEELTQVQTALLNAMGLADALDAIIKDHPQVAQFLPGLPSCKRNIQVALAAIAANAQQQADDAENFEWVCKSCGQREESFFGKPTICRNCGFDYWRRSDKK